MVFNNFWMFIFKPYEWYWKVLEFTVILWKRSINANILVLSTLYVIKAKPIVCTAFWYHRSLLVYYSGFSFIPPYSFTMWDIVSSQLLWFIITLTLIKIMTNYGSPISGPQTHATDFIGNLSQWTDQSNRYVSWKKIHICRRWTWNIFSTHLSKEILKVMLGIAAFSIFFINSTAFFDFLRDRLTLEHEWRE